MARTKKSKEPPPNPIRELRERIDGATLGRAQIAENRGYDKDLARESYEAQVEDLAMALEAALGHACTRMESRDVERLAGLVLRFIEPRVEA